MWKFKATLDINIINPFVLVPEDILEGIFLQAGKSRGFIPLKEV